MEETEEAIRSYALRLQREGVKADIPRSKELFELAFDAWKKDPTRWRVELQWRMAALVHGAKLIMQNNFAGAAGAYTPTPSLENGVVPSTAYPCDKLAAMMAVGRAYAMHRQGRNTFGGEAAERLKQLNDPRCHRWLGFTELLTVLVVEETGGTRSADTALQLLDPELQPELYAIALHKSGKGDGRVKRTLVGSRRAQFKPEECLYFFND